MRKMAVGLLIFLGKRQQALGIIPAKQAYILQIDF